MNLETTNLLLGIMAAVSVLEALVLLAVGVMAYRLYASAMRTVSELEARRIAPLAARVEALLGRVDDVLVDVKAVTSRVTDRTERVDYAIRQTMDRVDETAGRVRSTIAQPVNTVLGLMHGARAALDTLLHGAR